MQARLDPRKVAPEAMKVVSALHTYVRKSGIEHDLLELVKLRASQMNGCAWCMDMHTKELRAAGESEQRLYLLSAWRECPFYSDRERAALCLDRSPDLARRRQCPGRRVCAGASAVQRRGPGEAHDCDRRHQWRQPHQHRLSHRPRQLPDCGPYCRGMTPFAPD